ncbi:hypothetical protein NM688_g3833 [Phlebia brevispora]|uniref:Uncharacterized protein n=1 Tax=Phlebia brevispora TaxID=194682 RepID=A0ACC1T4M4_9APHY|nr:hypothetical protein NM688_g3833 [Phlebia brevispora]
MATLLDSIRDHLAVDVDSMDPDVASRHTAGGKLFCDMTSNQAIVYSEAVKAERAHILRDACTTAKASGLDVEHQVADALDLLNVLLAAEIYPHLTGRVHVQTSPSKAYDTEGTIAHAKRLVAVFSSHGIPKERVCIKIPATPESILACQYLEKIGIRTLATCLFSLPQALAASQAGCLYIAPYFNELRVHFEPGIWKAYEDPAKEHPASAVIRSIVQAFKARHSKTLVMPASIVTATEVVALVSLQPDHLTLSGAVLDKLASTTEDVKIDAVSETEVEQSADGDINFLADNGSALREALAADAEATRKLADALKIFDEMEQRTKELIKTQLSAN